MIVVTGATGNVGRALIDQLAAAAVPVRALTRDPDRARLPDGVEAARLDLAAPDTLAAAFAGASALFLHGQAVAHQPEHTRTLLVAARRGGVGRVVVLSSSIIAEGADESHPIHVMHTALETAVRETDLDWTFLRPGGFAVNAFQWAPQIRAGDTVRGPFAPIHEADIAAVAVRALLDEGHTGVAHRLTGPEAVTNEETVEAIGRALGRTLRFVEIPPEDVDPGLFPHVPAAMLPELLKSFAEVIDLEPEITKTVETVTGTPARTFDDWARDHADAFTS